MKPITLEAAALLGAGLGQERDALGDALLGGMREQVERQLAIEAHDREERQQAKRPDQVRARVKQTLQQMRKAGIKKW